MDLAARLRAEARTHDERRVLVLAGAPEATRERAADALHAADVADAVSLGPADFPCETLPHHRATDLLGTTRDAVVVDCQAACRPNAIGRAVGAVDGGGLLVLVTPPLDDWPERRDDFDETLAVPPFERADVTGHFRSRLVETLRAHRGVAIVDVDAGTVVRDGLVDPPPRRPEPTPDPPADHRFPAAAYDACLTSDQRDAVLAFEGTESALVIEADRGRGKSSAAGLAGASLAYEGKNVLVTAPAYRNAREVFARAEALLDELGGLEATKGDPPRRLATADGDIRFAPPAEAVALPGDPDAVVVDEAAALPVSRLSALLAAPRVAFATTVHGYEGAGRSFDVRFRDRLADSDHDVREVTLSTPIRYAPGDPVEVWAFRALALDARPPVDPLVADATPETVTYRALDGEDLLADEHLLRAVFGLLVFAHYRTEPDDFARLLDAPNVSVRALTHDGHVVSVALLAREGGLPADLRARMYGGARVRGNMIPDVLTTQCRDERAGAPVGWRVLRIATHHRARSRGLGSQLLAEIRAETDCDYLGVGYGVTPDLADFWRANGFRTVHLSTTRNDASGEYSAVMLDPVTDAGESLCARHTDWFLRRLPGVLSDPLADADPDVVRAVCQATAGTPSLSLTDAEWRVVAGTARGAAIFDTAPRPFRCLALRHLVAPAGPADAEDASGEPASAEPIDARTERLFVRKVLQGHPWAQVAAELDYPSPAECKRALGSAAETLTRLYGAETAREDLDRL